MNKLALLIGSAVLWAGTMQAKPADHLVPEWSYFDVANDPLKTTPMQRDFQVLQTAFEFAFQYRNTRLRVLERGGDDKKESVVGISSDFSGRNPSIYVLQAQDFLGSFDLFHNSSDARNAKVDKCEIPIEPALADRIVDLTWALVLQTTYYQADEQPVTDGLAEYHIHVEVPDYDIPKSIEGWTYAMRPERKVGAFIRLTEKMREYCQARDAHSLSALQDQVDVLAKKMEADKP